MAEVIVINDGKRVAKTSKAFNVKITHELMRSYTASFELANNDNAVKYITKNSQFIIDNEKFDILSYDNNVGSENTTSVTAQHYSYRLNDFKMTIFEYSSVATLEKISQEILDLSFNEAGEPASKYFSIQNVPDIGTISFSLGNPEEVTARYAILALNKCNVEIDFSNNYINLFEDMGRKDVVFKFGTNLRNVKRCWTRSNGESITADIADLFMIEGSPEYEFNIGDYATIDMKIGNSLIEDTEKKRIISYTKCLDDPTVNSIVLGEFVPDIANNIAMMSVDVDRSIKQGEDYNNVSISHADGFHANAVKNGIEVDTYMNGSRGFEVYTNGVRKFFVGSDGKVYCTATGTNENNYACIGTLSDNTMGLELFANKERFCSLVELEDGGFRLNDLHDMYRVAAQMNGTIIHNENGQNAVECANDKTSLHYGSSWLAINADRVELYFNEQNAVGADSEGAFFIQNRMRYYFNNFL